MKFYQTWQGALLASSDTNDVIKSFPAEVPGNLQYDLAVAEGIADTLMYSTTAQRFLEVEDNFWKYETTLDYKVEAGERAIFVAEGIDYIFDIIIDGIASNACTMTRSSHLVAPDGAKITGIYDVHGTTNPICDGTFTETFSFDLPSASGTYTFVFSAQ